MKKINRFWIIFYLTLLISLSFSQNQTETGMENSELEGDGLNKVIENIDFKDTDFRDVIRSIATKYNLNIFVDNSIAMNVTLHLSNVKVYDALQFIIEEKNLRLVKTGSILKILPEEKQAPKPKEIIVEYANGNLTLDFKGEKLDEAMRVIAQKSGKTILLDQFASGNIKGYMQNIPFETGLQQLLENNGFILEKKKDIYVVRMAQAPFEAGDGKSVKSRGSFYLNVEDSLISLDVNDAPLNQLVQEAARKLNKSVFIYGKIEGTLSARVSKLEFTQLLDFIFQGSNYTYKIENDVFLIGDKTVKGISSAELIKLNYLKSEGIDKILPKSITQKAEINIITEQNGIMVIGTKGVIKELQDYISKIDRPSPQILIEALVIDFNTTKMRDISVKTGYSKSMQSDTSSGRIDQLLPGLDILFNSADINRFIDKAGNFLGMGAIGKLPSNFFLQLKALESEGIAEIRSRPQIATLNGYPAKLSIGQTQYYKLTSQTPYQQANIQTQPYISTTERFQTIEANITLEITPWVSASGEITTEISPVFQTPVGSFSSEVPPTIQSREMHSTLRLKDGETIVLGGLIQTTVDENNQGLPYIKDIPVLGELFKSKSYNKTTSELVIYVTPHLYYFDE